MFIKNYEPFLLILFKQLPKEMIKLINVSFLKKKGSANIKRFSNFTVINLRKMVFYVYWRCQWASAGPGVSGVIVSHRACEKGTSSFLSSSYIVIC